MPVTRRANASLIVGTALFGLGAGALYHALQIAPDSDGGYGARTFPVAASLALALLGLLEGRRGLSVDRRRLAITADPKAIAALIAMSAGYVWLMSQLGYLISTGLIAPMALWVFGLRNPVGLILAAILCPAIYHLLFFQLLGVFPPYGARFDLLDILQAP